MGDDLILKMAKTHQAGVSGVPWRLLPPAVQDSYYDAMHAAVLELREPTDDMLKAAQEDMTALMREIADDRGVATQNVHERFWTVMVDKLLEVK